MLEVSLKAQGDMAEVCPFNITQTFYFIMYKSAILLSELRGGNAIKSDITKRPICVRILKVYQSVTTVLQVKAMPTVINTHFSFSVT